jgi:hypothetical protein
MFGPSMWGDLAMLMPVRNDLFKSLNRNFPYLSKASIVILALVVIVTSELSASTIWSAAAPSAIPSMEVVNRTHKGDRLPLPRAERPNHEFPVGCESVVSSVLRSPLTHIARRCLS